MSLRDEVDDLVGTVSKDIAHLVLSLDAIRARLAEVEGAVAALRADLDSALVATETDRGSLWTVIDELRKPAPRQPVDLSEEQRRDLRTLWTRVVCPNCGTIHQGITCSRVRETRFHESGRPERVVFWPNSNGWAPPPGAIYPEDVFGGGPAPYEEPVLPPNNTVVPASEVEVVS